MWLVACVLIPLSTLDLGKKTCELLSQILRGVSISSDHLCLIYAGLQASPFSLYAIFMREKGGKVARSSSGN